VYDSIKNALDALTEDEHWQGGMTDEERSLALNLIERRLRSTTYDALVRERGNLRTLHALFTCFNPVAERLEVIREFLA